jgi:PhnB protein
MASRLNPYLSFGDNARQAFEFYRDVFGGELALSTFGEFGQEGPAADLIMHGQLETPSGYTIMGADTPPGMERQQGSSMTVSLSGDDDDLRGYWDKLSGSGGQVTMPLEKQAWGDEFGMCVDQFGIPWMVNISSGEAGQA